MLISMAFTFPVVILFTMKSFSNYHKALHSSGGVYRCWTWYCFTPTLTLCDRITMIPCCHVSLTHIITFWIQYLAESPDIPYPNL